MQYQFSDHLKMVPKVNVEIGSFELAVRLAVCITKLFHEIYIGFWQLGIESKINTL